MEPIEEYINAIVSPIGDEANRRSLSLIFVMSRFIILFIERNIISEFDVASWMEADLESAPQAILQHISSLPPHRISDEDRQNQALAKDILHVASLLRSNIQNR